MSNTEHTVLGLCGYPTVLLRGMVGRNRRFEISYDCCVPGVTE